MARTGIGQDGYFRVQKEVTYGTALTNAMTLWPVKPDALIKSMRENIENDNIISSRLKQNPNKGREVSTFEVPLDMPPTLIGQMFQFFLGASSDAGPTDSTYTHTWLMPASGSGVGYSFTGQQALGSDLADTYAGLKIHQMVLSGDSQGNVLITLSGTAEGVDNQGVSRISSFSYPSAIPFNFSMFNLNIDPSDDSAFDQLCNSFELTVNLGLDENRFKMGSYQQKTPLINTIPSLSLKVNIDADKQFVNAARAHTTYDFVLSLTSTEYAGGTTPYKFEVEIPKGRLVPDTSITNANDTLTMDLEFDCGYGGTTTGSGSTAVMGEFRVVDATAAYA